MNNLQILFTSITFMAVLGLLSGALLAFASIVFAVKVDLRLEEVERALPGANCGACGYAGCKLYAESLLAGGNPALCRLGGEETTKKVTRILGIKEYQMTSEKAAILCGAGMELCVERAKYTGEKTCRANTNTSGGSSTCTYGCLAYGDCALVCPVDAFTVREKLPPVIDRDKCIGCGKCVDECPRKIIVLEDARHKTFVSCLSNDKGAYVKNICKVGCIACRICVTACPEGSMTMTGRLPKPNYENEPTPECIKKCPQDTIVQYQ